jgi:hypothetical protein
MPNLFLSRGASGNRTFHQTINPFEHSNETGARWVRFESEKFLKMPRSTSVQPDLVIRWPALALITEFDLDYEYYITTMESNGLN